MHLSGAILVPKVGVLDTKQQAAGLDTSGFRIVSPEIRALVDVQPRPIRTDKNRQNHHTNAIDKPVDTVAR